MHESLSWERNRPRRSQRVGAALAAATVLAIACGGQAPDLDVGPNALDGDIAVVGFTLVDADGDREIRALVDGDVLDASTLQTQRLNVRANTNPPVVGSVRFSWSGQTNERIENVAPYALFGDFPVGDYLPGTLGLGTHTIGATPHWMGRGAGAAGRSLAITFRVEKRTAPTRRFPGVEWEVATPESQGIDRASLDAAVDHLRRNSGFDGTRELVIIRNGYLVHAGDNIDVKHRSWSVGKIFTSTALGLLIDDGRCALDTRAHQIEPLLAPLYSNVTLRNFATMTSGYDAAGASQSRERGDWSATPYAPTAPLFAPGTQYLYWDEAMMMFARVLTRIADQDLRTLLANRVTNAIGMGSWNWETSGSVAGIPIRQGGGFVVASARQLARFAYLFLARGNWDGRQLISESWVDRATAVQVPRTLPLFEPDGWTDGHIGVDGRGVYGYHFWRNGIGADGKRPLPALPETTFYRTGKNHNMVFVVPDLDLIVVRLGQDADPPDRMGVWNTFFQLLSQNMIR